MKNLDEVQIDPDFPDRVMFIGAHSPSPLWEEIIAILTKHRDCFARSYANMTGIDPSIITHQRQVDLNVTRIKQKRIRFTLERDSIIDEEVQKSLGIMSIREIHYPD